MSEDSTSSGRILVGPVGWSYKDWEGQVYPTPKPRGFDHLAYLAQYFDAIEINSTFYRIPAAKTTQQWVDRVSDHEAFRFTAKLWQGFTHEGTTSTEDEAAFRRAMDPLHKTGRLGVVLLQFPYRFHPHLRKPGAPAAPRRGISGVSPGPRSAPSLLGPPGGVCILVGAGPGVL